MNFDFKKLIPHAIAVIVFVIVSAIFCKPVLEGNVMNQHDNIGWKGMAQNVFEYKEKNGHFPLWNPNLFSGMPNYQVAMEGKSILPDTVKILTLGLPKPMNFFFLACLCFYILCLILRINPIIGTLCAIAYSFSTYNPVIIAAGHDTQMLATGIMPLLIGGLISIYEKKYWLGLALTTFGTYQQLSVNHLQVSYYFFLIAAFITVSYLIKWIKERDWRHIAFAGFLTLISASIGVAGNALVLKTTAEYSKFTMRGGKDISINGNEVKAAKTSGLDTSYAFEYSLGKAETLTLLMPNAFGGYSSNVVDEKSNVIKKLVEKGIPEDQVISSLQSSRIPKYWGQIYTSGPAYLGVIIFLIGLLGFLLVKTPLKWGLLVVTLMAIFMTWGKNFPTFNVFLFEHLPLYNKFRAPSFAQVIPQLTMGIMAALTLHLLLFTTGGKDLLKEKWKLIVFTLAGVFGILAILYIGMDYSIALDRQIIDGYADPKGSDEIGRLIVAGLKEDRKSMFGGQIVRALGLAAIAFITIYLYFKNRFSAITSAIVLLIVSTLDITILSNQYFSNDKGSFANRQEEDQLFIPADMYSTANFSPNVFDNQILQDKAPNFRVFNTLGTSSGSPFSESKTSYFHKSIGGYHPAKLRIYQDIIEMYLSGNISPEILNMLNTKYVIRSNAAGNQPVLDTNFSAYGNCWLVKNIKTVDSRVEVIKTIGNTNLKDTVVIEKFASASLSQPKWDSLSHIRMTKFDPDMIEYSANCNGPQFAVFSEIYYPKGWNAYINGKKTDYYNVNYILRGIPVPSGQHTIKFVFEPESVSQGRTIMFVASILILIIFVGGLFMAWKTSKQA